MSIKQELLRDLKQAGLAPSHRFGQNFMIDESAVQDIIAAADLQQSDRVLEIGPGTGILTQRILPLTEAVMAVEIDKGMAQLLRQKFSETHLQLVHGDALAKKTVFHEAIRSFIQEPWKMVANLPYDVSLPVILNALAVEQQPSHIIVTVQKEAAERLCAKPGTKIWGSSAAVAQSAGQGRIVRKLAPACFHPRPRVDSVVLLWESERAIPQGFPAWCKRLFGFRRKLPSRALRDCDIDRDIAFAICEEYALDQGQRVEDLSVEQLHKVFYKLQAPSAEERP